MIQLIFLTQAAFAIVATLLVLFCLKKTRRDPRYPPGPSSLPLLGNFIQLGRDPLRVLQKWAEKYGPIFSIKLGTRDVIIISDPKLAKEIFSDIYTTGRAQNAVTNYLANGYGIVAAQDQIWETQRRFTLRKLRDVGVLKSSIEGFIMKETATLNDFFKERVGKPIPGIKLYNGPVVNALWRTISGESIDWAALEKPAILKSVEYLVNSLNRTAVSGLYFASFLRHIAPGFFGWTDWTNSVNNFFMLTNKSVEKHMKNFDPNNPRDFIDSYLVKMQQTKDPTSYFYKDNGEKNLRAIVGDLFLAGTETSSLTLSFATLYLIHNLEAQRDAQQEIDGVVGSRQISLSDRVLLPYTEAIILETLRLSSIIPLGIPHQMLADTEFQGFFLPKGATVVTNAYGIHYDPKIWGDDVNKFRPERFLSNDKKHVIRHEALIPFSVGRRSCIGEGFAKDVIFLFVASILQKFNLEPGPDCPIVDIEPICGVALEPKPFNFVVNLRN